MLQYAVPPGYRREQPIQRPKLGPWLGVIDAILSDDKRRPAKQRHTAKRIFDRLKEEHQFTGGYTIVKDYVRSATLRSQEMFVPLTHPPGEAQADFGEAVRQLPTGEWSRLVQSPRLLFEQRQIVQRIEDYRLAFIAALVSCDDLTSAGNS